MYTRKEENQRKRHKFYCMTRLRLSTCTDADDDDDVLCTCQEVAGKSAKLN